jgi:SAM-dependent methyltransferase
MIPESEYLERMEPEDIHNYPCINCLLDTENQINKGDFSGFSEGDKTWYETYQKETEEFKKVLLKYKPKEIIEVGSGAGRIIKLILDIFPNSWILGTELNQRMFDFVSKRFSKEPKVSIRRIDASDFLSREENYDMAICLMNTFGNINDSKLFEKMINRSKIFVFSLYNREFDRKRKKMYVARGHSELKYDGEKYCYGDPWVKGVVSKSYTEKEIENLVAESGGKIVSLEKVGISYFVVVKKG